MQIVSIFWRTKLIKIVYADTLSSKPVKMQLVTAAELKTKILKYNKHSGMSLSLFYCMLQVLFALYLCPNGILCGHINYYDKYNSYGIEVHLFN